MTFPKRLLSFIVFVFLVGSSFCFVKNASVAATTDEEIKALNDKIAAQKDKIKELDSTIEKYKKNIADTQLQASSLKNQLSILDNRVAQTEADIEQTQDKIEEAKLEIQALNITIKSKQQIMDRQKALVAKMVQNIQADDQKNYLEIMLTNRNFADFFNQLSYLESVYSDLGKSVKNVRESKEDVEAKQKQVVDRQKAYEDLQKQLVQKKNDLEDRVEAKQTLLAQTHNSEQKYQTLLSSLKKQYASEQAEINSTEAAIKKKLEQQNKIEPTGDVSFAWPLPTHYITAYFHDSSYPFKNVFQHSAIDIRTPQGSPVRAAASGYVGVARTCTSASCYAYVLIIHTGNLSTVYGHLSRIDVKPDQFVTAGDVIGLSGATPGTVGAGPFTTGAHLHFEVRLNGIPVDPLGYLAQ
jgi:murein DD-endopeptidase MepM/ murein hydrolase activator NlpD